MCLAAIGTMDLGLKFLRSRVGNDHHSQYLFILFIFSKIDNKMTVAKEKTKLSLDSFQPLEK